MNSKKIVAEFKRRFKIIESKGFIKSHRLSDTGIGKTFEDEIGVIENNLQDVDFMGYIEIKTKREESDSMLTLFTQAPTSPKKANRYLQEKYGTPDTVFPEYKVLHTTVSGADYNTFNEQKYGFKLECDDENKRLYILVRDNQTGKILEDNIYYDYETVKSRVEHKCAVIAFIDAETEKRDGWDYFHFTSVKLLSVISFDTFLEGIKTGVVKYDFRIGVYKSGVNKGKYHDHGSGFRIRREDIPKLFNVEELN